MQLLKKYMCFTLLVNTLPTHTKLSFENVSNSVSKLFSKNKVEDIIHQEFKNVKTLELLAQHGSISIHTWKQTGAVLECKKTGNQLQLDQTTITAVQHDDLLQIKTLVQDKKNSASVTITLIIPENASVKIKTHTGDIVIKHVNNTINAQTDAGNITIVDGSGDIDIVTKSGDMLIQREHMLNTDHITALANSGNIILQVPQHMHSQISALTKNGKVYSDLFIKVHEKTTKLNDEVYRQQKQQVVGSIAKDGSALIAGSINLETKNGTIKIQNYV